jgi:hypothetical protein
MGRRGKAPAHPTLAKIEGHYKEKARTRILPIEAIDGRPKPSLVCQADDLTLQIFEETCDSMQQMGCLNYHRFLANHMKLLQELALTPSARTRLATPQGPKQSDKVGQLLEKLGGK